MKKILLTIIALGSLANSTVLANSFILGYDNNVTQNINKGVQKAIYKRIIAPYEYKISQLNKELARATSEDQKLKLSAKINKLAQEKRKAVAKVKYLQEELAKYKDNKIVKEVTQILEEKGIDAALAYLESKNFSYREEQNIKDAQALLIQANLYNIKNRYKKAGDTYKRAIKFNRNFATMLSYALFLQQQNDNLKAIARYKVMLMEDDLNLTTANRATTLNNLAILYSKQNRPKEAEKAYNEALTLRRALAKTNPPQAYNPYVAGTLNNLATLYGSQNRLKEAEKAYNEALTLRRALAKTNPQAYNSDVAGTLDNLANLYSDQNRPKEGEKACNEALTLYRALAKTKPQAYKPYVAITLDNLANLYSKQNRLKEGEKAYNEALTLRRALAKTNPQAYGIDYAKILIMGVDYFNRPKSNLEVAKKILLKYPGVHQAEQLLGIAKRLQRRQ